MRDRLAIGAGILALTILSYFQFPGHTWLASDTQIYVPMLEHIWDSSALARDLVATKPHLAFTLYDEIAVALRWITRSSFKAVLTGEQFLFRACEILGVFLLAASFPLTRRMAMLVAALFTLGATIVGPAVLTFEYEPVPRAFSIGLIFLAIGLAAQGRLMLADIAAAASFLYHPPTVWIFWALYLWLTLRQRDFRDLWPLAAGVALLFVSAQLQPNAMASQALFTRVSPELEKLQRMRASYNWVSTWTPQIFWQYISLWIVSLIAFWRVRPKAGRLFLIGMPALGILSVPLSYLLLEKLKWGLIPQFQLGRAVLFVTAFAVILVAAAGIRAAENKRWIESTLWFAAVFAVPAAPRLFSMRGSQIALVLSLAVALSCAVYFNRYLWTLPAIGAFFLLPTLGHVRNYPRPDLAPVEDLARFARTQTPKDAVFLFGDAGQALYPGVFRAEALRAVYVDWKSGGQMNYRESIGLDWWQRWQQTNGLRFGTAPPPGVDYLVLTAGHPLSDRQPIYENTQFVAYRTWGSPSGLQPPF